MKSILALILVSLIGCNQNGNDSADAAPDSAVAPAIQPASPDDPAPPPEFTLSGNYTRLLAPPTYNPCPNCVASCQFGGGWVCIYISHQLPAACSISVMGSFNLDPTGSQAEAWGLTLPGGIGKVYGTPYIDWTANNQQDTTFVDNTVTFPQFNYNITIHDFDETHKVVDFGGGCALLYAKSDYQP